MKSRPMKNIQRDHSPNPHADYGGVKLAPIEHAYAEAPQIQYRTPKAKSAPQSKAGFENVPKEVLKKVPFGRPKGV